MKTLIREGDPGLIIADYADEVHADLIVMPSHGYHGVKRLLLGSVAERVLRHANCPARFRQTGSRSFSLRILHVAGRRRRARRPHHRSDRSCWLCGDRALSELIDAVSADEESNCEDCED